VATCCYTTDSTSTGAWRAWASTSTDADFGSNAWTVWCDGTTNTTASCTGCIVWSTWNSSSAIPSTRYVVIPAPTLSPEEQAKLDAERERRREEMRLAEEQRAKEQKEAEEKAARLLRQHLSLRQRRAYRRHRAFCVRARDGTQYRLRHGWAGNVEELDKQGRPVARLCIHPYAEVPVHDNLLAQKLMLETDPDGFRRIANRTPIRQRAVS
jgi:hypothetical protein